MFIFVKSKEKPAGRGVIPSKGFDAGIRKYKHCPSGRSDLHGLLCRKNLKDIHLPAFLLRVSEQIRATIQTKLIGPDPQL
ncbi:hypothetical protein MACH10_28650 [Thalassospira tepidiphila]|nr:hypothetical protein MACH10_28650 [Thalassospira tepidiphila]